MGRKHEIVDDYVRGCSAMVGPRLEELRAFVHETLPDTNNPRHRCRLEVAAAYAFTMVLILARRWPERWAISLS